MAGPPRSGPQSLLDSTPNSSFGNHKNRAVLWSVLESNGYSKPSSKTEALRLLEQAGRARFLGKSGAFAAFMKEMPPPEALYQALMESLGYSENRAGFLELAQRVSYEALTKATSPTLQQERPRLIQKSCWNPQASTNLKKKPPSQLPSWTAVVGVSSGSAPPTTPTAG